MLKKLLKRVYKSGGRNNQGRITVFTKSGGHKRLYRFVDFKQNMLNVTAKIMSVDYDPNRSANIALVLYSNGVFSYILAGETFKAGDFVRINLFYSDDFKGFQRCLIGSMPLGSSFFNLELEPSQGGVLVRSAGCAGVLLKKMYERNLAVVKLPSSEYRLVSLNAFATLGVVSNSDHRLNKLYKAGQSRWLGVKPSVRGVAMNPIDHPHGGGQGKTSGGRPSVTPWGWYTKGKKTRRVKSISSKFIVKRRIMNPRKYVVVK